ncbi:replication-associated recombination protein A [Geothermobacter hydrogeniphilus]|uniref:Replication-associated recombination protein A n=1 Tax=Geothermobacter hydrogeniphilus TaxID=1969733 RepID=A0A1X0Y5T7_9BACT|nr:replication-associated recombination protein A [Geothermobacter hydrogeniphilus]ORJ60513.1 AAA family ATPase [Geothermobacter hydrogeniphilus]
MDLFEQAPAGGTPLAERLRPRNLDEVVGQQHLLGPGRLLRQLISSDRISSLILWGPPGVGKTTLAQVIANSTSSRFVFFSAVLQGVKEIREIVAGAREERAFHDRRTVLFVDEIHRFNKAQQDAFLPYVEKGDIILIGATTENPSFEVNAALLSRSRVFTLEPLPEEEIGKLLDRALEDPRGLGGQGYSLTEEAKELLCRQADGDARTALNALETAAAVGCREIDAATVQQAMQTRTLRYDKGAEEHYNVISAFIKSVRGSDPDAALYWLARMLEAGEDPLFIARRLVILASEDIGNADPRGLQLAIAAQQAVHFIGLPEGRIPLAQATTYLAAAPKSNAAYAGIKAAQAEVRKSGSLPVPLHIRNAPTGLMKQLGYGAGYQYAHNDPQGIVTQSHLPEQLAGSRYYQPTDHGFEKTIGERLAWLEQLKNNRATDEKSS